MFPSHQPLKITRRLMSRRARYRKVPGSIIFSTRIPRMNKTLAAKSGAVTVVDAIMGAGKTTWIIEEMRRRHAEGIFSGDGQPPNFLYIATTLAEADRIKNACPELHFVDPIPESGRKLTSLNRLIREGHNICSTHALFKRINRETYEALEEARYILVIDEVLDCVSQWELKRDDRRALFENRMIHSDDNGRLHWNHGLWPDYDGRYNDIRDLCDNGNLCWHRGKFLIWELPVDMLSRFEHTFVLTYLFQGSMMRSYLDLHGVPYEVRSVVEGRLVPHSQAHDAAVKARLRQLVTVVDDPRLNRIGTPKSRENPLSVSWFQDRKRRKDDNALQNLRLDTENFFRHYAGTPSSQNMWTTFKDVSPRLKGRGYSRGFVAVNTKATNDHIERRSLAYLANIFPHPVEVSYFQDQGIGVDTDAYALSEMLQWIWRSQIRRGDPITLYIPSQRMRGLFRDWLEGSDHATDGLIATLAQAA